MDWYIARIPDFEGHLRPSFPCCLLQPLLHLQHGEKDETFHLLEA